MARYTILDNQRGKNLFFNGRDTRGEDLESNLSNRSWY